MNVKLDVAKGKWRNLSSDEIAEINKMVKTSTKTLD
jgi:23S rRNA pseudouridine2604 synthase